MKANINEIQAVYSELPSRYIYQDTTYDNYQLLTELHYSHGWRDVVIPTITEVQKLSEDFILTDDIITKEVIDLTEEEIAELNKVIVPKEARSMNLRIVLINNGISMKSIYDTIEALPFPENELGYQMFEYATHYDRNNYMIISLANIMGVTDEQLDDFFIQANNIIL